MKCPNCGGQMGLEDAFCPYCGTPNAQAVKHQSDMDRFRREYQRTQADVMERTSLLQNHGSWLVILVVLLVALVIGVVLNVSAWDIGYSIRTNNVKSSAEEDARAMDAFLAEGDYGQFVGYYDSNDISLDYDSTDYEGVRRAAREYTKLLQYVSTLSDPADYGLKPKYISNTCSEIADCLIEIYTIDKKYPYDSDRYLPPDKRVYVEDIRDRATAIAKTYFGLTDEQIKEIPNVSTTRLAAIIEEGITS